MAALAAAPLRVGVEPLAEQLSQVAPDGTSSGFAVSIVQAVADDQHLEVQFVGRPWPDLLSDYRAGKIDIIAAAGATPEREGTIAFTTPHIDMLSEAFANRRIKLPARSEDLGTLRIGTTEKSLGHEYIRSRGWSNTLIYPHLRDALIALDRGECDVVIAVSIIARHIIQEEKLQHIAECDFDLPLHYELRMGVAPANRALLYQLNNGLAHIRANGTYDRIYEQWIGPLQPHRVRWRDVWYFVVPAVLVFIAGFLAYLWQHRLMRRLALQAEQLKRSEERLTLVLEGSVDATWDYDVIAGTLRRSANWTNLSIYADSVARSEDIFRELIHPDDRSASLAAHDKMINGDGQLDCEYRIRTKDGEWLWMHSRGRVTTRDANGRALHAAGTVTNISARKATEENLRRSQRLLEQSQSVTQIGGWELDLLTHQLYWTEETYRIHEVYPESYRPDVETAIQFYDESSRARIRTAVERAIATAEPYDIEVGLVTARGRHIHVRTIGFTERDAHGRVIKLYGSFQDISEQTKATEERASLQVKMLEAQKLESLGVLAGGIAHDFNNILTIILANASFARLQTQQQPDLDQRLKQIGDAARRAADLCQRMLAYAGKSRLTLTSLDLSALVRDTEQLLRLSISKKVRLQFDLADGLPPIEADATQLRQVLMNLSINASEALGDRDGYVRITTGNTQLDEAALGAMLHAADASPGRFVTLDVADDGCGMSAETLAKIFDPFYTTKFTGRGLGLAVVHGIFRTHKGALRVESTLGHGTVFRLFLPVSAAAPAPTLVPVTPTSGAALHGSGVVLVADDESAVRDTAAAILRHYGYTPVLAADGHEALARFRAEPHIFAAVLLDLTMPGLDGAEALGAMRTVRPGVSAIIMSGFGEDETLDRLRHVGPAAFLHKPFLPDELAAKLSAAVAQSA